MSTKYNLEHILEELNSTNSTKFLNPLEYRQVKNKINIKKYEVYKPFEDCTKVIIYKTLPDISLIKISSIEEIRHQEILKCMFEMGLKEDMYGDIIIKDNSAYIYVFDAIKDDIIYHLKEYNRKIQAIEEIDIDTLNDYQMNYDIKELIVTSLRIDNIISNLVGLSRKEILNKFKDKEVILNYEVLTKYTANLNPGDIFSIRKYGKYKFAEIKTMTKRNNYIIIIKKYK